MKSDELAKCLLECLAVNYSIKPTGLLAAMKDGAAVNEAVLKYISVHINYVCGKSIMYGIHETKTKHTQVFFGMIRNTRILSQQHQIQR